MDRFGNVSLFHRQCTSIQQPACEGRDKSRVQSQEALLAHEGDACRNLRASNHKINMPHLLHMWHQYIDCMSTREEVHRGHTPAQALRISRRSWLVAAVASP